MADKKLTPIGNVSIVTGQYEKDGETKNRYLQIGTLFERVGKVGHVIKLAPQMDKDQIILVNLSGRGDKDLGTVMKALAAAQS